MTQMKTFYQLFFTALIGIFGSAEVMAQWDTIAIDFGAEATISDEPWNNMTNPDGQIAYLKNARGLFTPIGLQIYDRFTGVNESGSTSPEAALGFPSTATRDSYYGNVSEWAGHIEPTAAMQITGLDPSKVFTFEVFASRMGATDKRETKYRFEGGTVDSVYLDAVNNTALSATMSLKPKADSSIHIHVSPGENNTNSPYKFYYLGALKIVYEEEEALAPTLMLTSPTGGEIWAEESSHIISWTSINLVDSIRVSYSTDNGTGWSVIQKVHPSEGEITWDIPNELSDQCLVSVSSGLAEDVSQGVFSIVGADESIISLSAPDGGESWIIGSSARIMWSGSMLTEMVDIELSLDAKATWENIAAVPPADGAYTLTVPDATSSDCFVRLVSGTASDVSENSFSIVEGTCSNTIVVLGSSTAYGTGPSPRDSAWVYRFEDALTGINDNFDVVNLALGGYTTYQILPSGTIINDPGVSENIDVNRNITKALTYSPYAVIVNMPSNDANKSYGVDLQMANFDLIIDTANSHGVRVWIATSQPRNFTEAAKIDIQMDLKDAVLQSYGEFALDFWNSTADDDGFILSQYDSGDGVHLNNGGHRLLFDRVWEKQIDTLACFDPVGLQSPDAVLTDLKIYPNPFTDRLNIEFATASAGSVELDIFDYTGRKVGHFTQELSSSGIHLIELDNQDFNSSGGLVLVRLKIRDQNGVSDQTIKLIRIGVN